MTTTAATGEADTAPPPANKKIVICLDGTNDELGVSRPTNPAKVFQMLDLDDPSRQIAYYDPGVGTLPAATAVGKLGRWCSRASELAFGYGMKTNIIQAYTWLMNCYTPGDDIYVFGFSRGAYTARAFVSMLGRPGLLRSGSDNLVEYAVKQYARKRRATDTDVWDFADSLCWGTPGEPMNPDCPYLHTTRDAVHSIPVKFLGVWDTVKASGFAGIGEVNWPDPHSLWNVRRIRHAVAIDERRRPYREFLVAPRESVEEVWFAGVHSDIGGTFEDCRLATVALKWVFEAVCHELNLRDEQPTESFARWCTVSPDFATADIHKNDWQWNIFIPRRRRFADTAQLHETVRTRRGKDPAYLAKLANPDDPGRWADPDWDTPPTFS